MKKRLGLLLLPLFALVSCTSSEQKQEPQEQASAPVTKVENITHSLPLLFTEDTYKVGNNQYAWSVERKACDSLDVVVDEMGDKYYDNTITIHVKKNNSKLFSKTFKKSDFRHMLDKDFFKNSILDGCRFLKVHEGMVTFSLAVSYPDSDMSRPFILNIGPDGSYMILPDDNMDDEYVSDSI